MPRLRRPLANAPAVVLQKRHTNHIRKTWGQKTVHQALASVVSVKAKADVVVFSRVTGKAFMVPTDSGPLLALVALMANTSKADSRVMAHRDI